MNWPSAEEFVRVVMGYSDTPRRFGNILLYVSMSLNAEKEIQYSFRFWMLRNEKTEMVAYFKMAQLPGCCGIVVSFGTFVDPAFRWQGIGGVLQTYKEAWARENSYTKMMCTVILKNFHGDVPEASYVQGKILARAGWKQIDSFQNKRTENLIGIFVKDLS